MTFSDGEAALSAWMDRNAFVCWCEAAEQWLVEEELIRTVDLPLSLHQNRHDAFRAELRRVQAEQRAKAREVPTLPRQAPIGARPRAPLEAAPVDELG